MLSRLNGISCCSCLRLRQPECGGGQFGGVTLRDPSNCGPPATAADATRPDSDVRPRELERWVLAINFDNTTPHPPQSIILPVTPSHEPCTAFARALSETMAVLAGAPGSQLANLLTSLGVPRGPSPPPPATLAGKRRLAEHDLGANDQVILTATGSRQLRQASCPQTSPPHLSHDNSYVFWLKSQGGSSSVELAVSCPDLP